MTDTKKMGRPLCMAIIPARGGSKGLLRKNIRPLGGKPLIAHSIHAALKSSFVDRVLVTTDDEEIQRHAIDAGADAPFLRPSELAQDMTPTEPVLTHALEWVKSNEDYHPDIVLFLQPTDVLRKVWMIDQVVKNLIEQPELDSSFMALKTHKNYWRQKDGEWVRLASDVPPYGPRQKKPPIFREDTGVACASRAEVILAGKRVGEKVMPVAYDEYGNAGDIHAEIDLWMAERLFSEHGFDAEN